MTTLLDELGIPPVGLGLWKRKTPLTVVEALKEGYQHLDSACDYGNETEVGAGLAQAFEAGICRRDEVWITSKL